MTEALQAAREGTYDAQQKMLARWYAEQADWNQKLDRLMDAVFTVERKNLLERQWRGLCMEPFWKEVLPDWSSLQPVRMHIFLQYGLRLKEQEEYGLQAVDMGNVFHDALKYFSDKIEASE